MIFPHWLASIAPSEIIGDHTFFFLLFRYYYHCQSNIYTESIHNGALQTHSQNLSPNHRNLNQSHRSAIKATNENIEADACSGKTRESLARSAAISQSITNLLVSQLFWRASQICWWVNASGERQQSKKSTSATTKLTKNPKWERSYCECSRFHCQRIRNAGFSHSQDY